MKFIKNNIGQVLGGLVIFALIFASGQGCGNSSKPISHKSDTTFTTALVELNWNGNNYATSTLIRITKDSLKPDPSNPERNIILRDTVYYYPFIDTLRGANRVPLYDSTGKPKLNVVWEFTKRAKVLVDYNQNWQ